MNRLEVIRFFVNFRLVPAAILDFKKCTILPTRCLDTHKRKLGLKFGENRFNGSKDIQILVKFKKFKMAPSAILDFEIRYSDTAALLSICRGLNL